jgi:hypothetical protein
MGISEDTVAQIFKVVNQEITKQVNSQITRFAEIVAIRHDIPIKLLFEDIQRLDSCGPCLESEQQCAGKRTTGKRCKMKAKIDGYCKWHVDQNRKSQRPPPPPQMKRIEHTHTLPPMFLAGCPACERKSENKLLIDI